jgi:hypothetical protein
VQPRQLAATAMKLAGGSLAMMTLMACYGAIREPLASIDDACDAAKPLIIGQSIVDQNDGFDYSNLLQSNCGGKDEAERLYTFTAVSDGVLRANWSAPQPMIAYALRACNPDEVLVCADAAKEGKLDVPLKGAERVTIVVDGGGHKQRIEFTLNPEFL